MPEGERALIRLINFGCQTTKIDQTGWNGAAPCEYGAVQVGVPVVRDHGCATGHGLDDAVPEGFVEVDEVEQAVRVGENRGSVSGVDGSDVGHAIVVEVCRDLGAEVALVLDDAGDDEPSLHSPGDFDRVGGALVRVNAAEEEQVIARAWM